jgi:hypothetical protein
VLRTVPWLPATRAKRKPTVEDFHPLPSREPLSPWELNQLSVLPWAHATQAWQVGTG